MNNIYCIMNYSESYTALKNLFTSPETIKEFDTIEMHDLFFKSMSCAILPGIEEYRCELHNVTMQEEYSFYTEIGTIDNNVHIKDIYVKENQSFKYQIIKPKEIGKVKKATFLFH